MSAKLWAIIIFIVLFYLALSCTLLVSALQDIIMIFRSFQSGSITPIPQLFARLLFYTALLALLAGIGSIYMRNRKTLGFFLRFRGIIARVLVIKIKKLFYTTPLIGEINDSYVTGWEQSPVGHFGMAIPFPFAVEITIDETPRDPGGVGRLVRNVFFEGYDPIYFNVCFSCGRSKKKSHGYADPRSIWFNVFFGYYQIDMAMHQRRNAPFGYTRVSRPNLPDTYEVNVKELLSMAKADWNYFSNYLYGVPEEKIIASGSNKIKPFETDSIVTDLPKVRIGDRYWDVVEIKRICVVSGYENPRKKERQATSDYQSVWDHCYDPYPPSRSIGDYANFYEVEMRVRFLMFYETGYDCDAGQEVYRSYFFGGSVNNNYAKEHTDGEKENQQFLEQQLEEIVKIIKAKYGNKGFVDEFQRPLI